MPRPLQIGAVLLGLIAGCWSEGGPNDDLNLGDGYCEPLNCTDLLHLYIERRDQEAFIPGDYTVEIETAPEVITTIICTLEETDLFHCDGVPTGDTATINAALSTITIRLLDPPEKLVVTAYFDHDEIGSAPLTPSYQIITQSDPSCPETCYEGTTTLYVKALDD
jgi:hypothetical protein